MANNFTIKVTPDDMTMRNHPSFEFKLINNGIVFDEFNWYCLPGYMGAIRGVAKFNFGVDRWHLTLWNRPPSLFVSKAESLIYAMISDISPKMQVGETGTGLVDYSGYRLRKLIDEGGPYLLMFKEFTKMKGSMAVSNIEVIEAY